VKQEGPNVGARARVRLLRMAKERGEDFQLILLRYAHERLLYRLAASRHARAFVLKGAALFTVWTGHPHRATRDLDFLGFGEASEERLRAARSSGPWTAQWPAGGPWTVMGAS
jgi:predicted nucleotidyltransferase component of viral defense system